MPRFKVIRKSVRWNKQTYHLGEYLPETFTEKDKYRVLYPSRIAMVEDEPAKTVAVNSNGTKNAEDTSVAPTKTTGAALSGSKVKAKVTK